MNKDTKITLDALLARKEQSKEDKNKRNRRELYIPSLDGTITIKPPTRATIVRQRTRIMMRLRTGILFMSVLSSLTSRTSVCRRHTAVRSRMRSSTGYSSSARSAR